MIKNLISKVWAGLDWFIQSVPYGDKILHFAFGLIASLIVLAITGVTWYGFSAAFVLGLAKEGYDNYKARRQAGSWLDWFSSIAGGLLGELLFII